MERPTLRRGESLEDFSRRKAAWITSWTLDDALNLLVDLQDEGPQEEKACELICGAIERVRALCAANQGEGYRITAAGVGDELTMVDVDTVWPSEVLAALEGP